MTERFSALAANWVRFPGGDEDVSEPTPAWPLEAVLDGVAAAGFAAAGLDHYTTAAHGRVDDLGAMLVARGLRCTDVGVLPIGERGIVEAAHRLAHTASATGATLCIAAFYAPAPDPVLDLRAAAEILADAGVRLALEFTAYGDLRSLSKASDLCAAVGWERCGLLVDTWHFFRGGEPWPLLCRLRGDQIALVHVNDGAPASDIDPVFEGRFRRLPPGAGPSRSTGSPRRSTQPATTGRSVSRCSRPSCGGAHRKRLRGSSTGPLPGHHGARSIGGDTHDLSRYVGAADAAPHVGQVPVQTGSRFSRKAATPSAASFELSVTPTASRSITIIVSVSASSPRLSAHLRDRHLERALVGELRDEAVDALVELLGRRDVVARAPTRTPRDR